MFADEIPNNPILIYDNDSVFSSIDDKNYGIKGVNTCIASPNMNAFIERLTGSIRREALDHFLLFSEKQVRQIIKEYVTNYNHQRPHQGISNIPMGIIGSTTGIIKNEKILSGLHHHYYRSSA
jgi:putative transposase